MIVKTRSTRSSSHSKLPDKPKISGKNKSQTTIARVSINSKERKRSRSAPRQKRSQATYNVILDAAVQVLKQHGASAITTNKVAEKAGVSIGSLYQYFSDKQSIYIALHHRHIRAANHLLDEMVATQASMSLTESIVQLVDKLIDLHLEDRELYKFLLNDISHSMPDDADLDARFNQYIRDLIATHVPAERIDSASFIVACMLDALTHAVTLSSPANVSLAQLSSEATQAIVAYVCGQIAEKGIESI